MYDFQQYEARSFGDSIDTGENNIDYDKMDQSNLLQNMVKFNKSKSKR